MLSLLSKKNPQGINFVMFETIRKENYSKLVLVKMEYNTKKQQKLSFLVFLSYSTSYESYNLKLTIKYTLLMFQKTQTRSILIKIINL